MWEGRVWVSVRYIQSQGCPNGQLIRRSVFQPMFSEIVQQNRESISIKSEELLFFKDIQSVLKYCRQFLWVGKSWHKKNKGQCCLLVIPFHKLSISYINQYQFALLNTEQTTLALPTSPCLFQCSVILPHCWIMAEMNYSSHVLVGFSTMLIMVSVLSLTGGRFCGVLQNSPT